MKPQVDLKLALQFLQTLPIGILTQDAQGMVTWANYTLCHLIGVGADHLIGQNNTQLQHHDMGWLLTESENHFIAATPLRKERWIRAWCQPSVNDNLGRVWYYEDVTEIKSLQQERDRLNQELREQSHIDIETGLFNRRALLQILEPQVSRSRRYQNPLTIIILVAQLQGDPQNRQLEESLLMTISQLLKDQMRWADQIGRFATNEFLLILPETLAEDATKLCQKLASKLNPINHARQQKGEIPLLFSFGIAQWNKGEDTNRLLLRSRQNLESFSTSR